MKQLCKLALKYNSTFRSNSAEESLSANSCPCLAIACFCYQDEDDDGGGVGGVGGEEGDAEDYSDLCPCFALAPPLLVLSRQSPPPRTQTLSTVLKWRHISFCSICTFALTSHNAKSLHACFKRQIQPAAGLSPSKHLVGR